LICTEIFVWLTHQKLDLPEKFWLNFRNCGAIVPTATLGYALAHTIKPICFVAIGFLDTFRFKVSAF